MIMDRMLSFSNKQTVGSATGTTASTRCVDLRKNGNDIDHQLNILAYAVGTAPADGYITTTVQECADASVTSPVWTAVAGTAQTNVGNILWKGLLPAVTKRFVRLSYTVGTELSEDATVVAGITVGAPEEDALPAIQSYPPVEDLTEKNPKASGSEVVY